MGSIIADNLQHLISTKVVAAAAWIVPERSEDLSGSVSIGMSNRKVLPWMPPRQLVPLLLFPLICVQLTSVIADSIQSPCSPGQYYANGQCFTSNPANNTGPPACPNAPLPPTVVAPVTPPPCPNAPLQPTIVSPVGPPLQPAPFVPPYNPMCITTCQTVCTGAGAGNCPSNCPPSYPSPCPNNCPSNYPNTCGNNNCNNNNNCNGNNNCNNNCQNATNPTPNPIYPTPPTYPIYPTPPSNPIYPTPPSNPIYPTPPSNPIYPTPPATPYPTLPATPYPTPPSNPIYPTPPATPYPTQPNYPPPVDTPSPTPPAYPPPPPPTEPPTYAPPAITRCPDGTILIRGRCRLIYCGGYGVYKDGQCVRPRCTAGYVWTENRCSKPQPTELGTIHLTSTIYQQGDDHPKLVTNNVNNLNVNASIAIPGQASEEELEVVVEVPPPPQPPAGPCCNVVTPRICSTPADESGGGYKYYHDCSGCAAGDFSTCSSYCYSYKCPSHNCVYYDQAQFCAQYPDKIGCRTEDGWGLSPEKSK